MSKAYKCDRCGALFCSDIISRKYYITTSRFVSGICIDLCDECQKQLNMFATNKNAVISIQQDCNTCNDYHSSICVCYCENKDHYKPKNNEENHD